MEGYSVTEAASVLGVPTERVWELLARGVLSGVPDTETGMRVFLQPRPAPPVVEEPRRSNGHGNAREADAEASPFRELLTEFRGLTERYGQALLALGEARGEVASLRSRVDVLEARMDLRLPFASPPSPDPAWGGPSSTSSEPRPRVSDHPEAEVDGEHEGERSARRKRGRAHFSDEFADALARAEDPSPAVLRDAVRGAAPAAAVQPDRDEAIAEADVGDAGLPRELPPAETMADIEPEAEPAIAELEFVTPDAEPDAAPQPEAEVELEAAAELTTEMQPLQEPEPEADKELEPELIEAEPVPAAEMAAEALEAGAEMEPPPEAEPEPELPPFAAAPEAAAVDEQEPEAEPEPVESDAADASAAEVEPSRDSEPDAEAVTAAAAEGVPSSEPPWDQERYSAQIEEPDWWTPEESAWAEPVAAPSPAEDEPAAAEPHEERPSADAGVPAAPPVAAPEEVAIHASGESYAGEETMLWFGRQPASSVSEDAPSDDAAGEMEVASTGRRGWVSPEDGSGGMPGAQELDEALAGFDSLRELPAPTAADPKDPLTPAVPRPARPSTPAATTSDVPSVVSPSLRPGLSRVPPPSADLPELTGPRRPGLPRVPSAP